ncbi:type II toxin-antitoxin system RelE/ParE family toxin [Pseudanabaena sp. lw0831]|uniref:type II toxin-antitoxin system RelE/ParE family toxin n=1 Tax=Pseudanabaena sp. lw0831 TaxID=1357935 RepID=UPI0019159334|nr:type II toxin-antitoxin system RelE/ParE family toxin [Pseudanabaena sp. lw0831]
MSKSLIILPEAEQDVTEAYDWYQERELGLGEEFLRCIDATIQTIERNSEIYGFIYDNYRRALVRRFPYAIFYEYFEDRITVYAVFHCSQNPKKWRIRLN